jgi:uncharacterized membrane protein (DUF106 family)
MLEIITAACLAVADPLLGWMLYLPRDVALVIVAIGTALILTVVRVFTTNQDMLRRCQEDKSRIKELMRAAKKARDKEALARYQATLQGIMMKTLKAEGKPLLASLVPIVLVATWAFSRIAYLPVAEGDAVTLKVYTPLSAIGQWAHVVPQAGIKSETGWIQEVREDRPIPDPKAAPDPSAEPLPATNGVAEWVLHGEKRREPYEIQIRLKGRTIETELIVDGVHYAGPPQRQYGEDPATEVVEVALAEYKPFRIVPGWNAAMLQPWIVGYLIMVLPLAFVFKPMLRIH